MKKKTRIDLHVHTRGSDGHGTPAQYVKVCRENGLDGLVITDHHKTITVEGLKVRAALIKAGLFCTVGCEYSTASGHCLVYGVNVDNLDLGMYPEMQTVIDRVHAAGGVAIPAHPYKGYKTSLKDKLYELNVDTCEVRNGQVQTHGFDNGGYDRQAQEAADDLGMRGTGGSDAHWYDDVGICYTEFEGDITTPVGLVAALKAGAFKAVVDEARIESGRKVWTSWWAEESKKKAGKGRARPSMPAIAGEQSTWYNRWDESIATFEADTRDEGHAIKDLFFRGEEEGLDLEEDQIPWWAFDEEDESRNQAKAEESIDEEPEGWFEEGERIQKALKEEAKRQIADRFHNKFFKR